MTWIAIAIVILAIHNLGVERLPAPLYVPACLGTVALLTGMALGAGVGAAGIGWSAAGLGTGLAVAGAAALIVVIAGVLPATRPVFADRRMAGVGPRGTAYRALVRIPMGTVVLEEVAFRGTLLALVDRLVPLGWAVVASSLLFGVWHVVPVRATLVTNRLPVRPPVIGAAVLATGMAGAGLCWLRISTGSLAAPMLLHAAASATATVVAALVVGPPDWAHDRRRS